MALLTALFRLTDSEIENLLALDNTTDSVVLAEFRVAQMRVV